MIDFSVKYASLHKRLKAMHRRGENLQPVFDEIGKLIRESVDENFQEGGRHNGNPESIFGGSERWEEVSEKWARRKLQLGGDPDNILLLDGNLVGSLDHEASKDEVVISAGMEYAERQHHGGGGIPARPFLVIQEEDLDEILEDLSKFIVSGKS